MAGFNNTVQLAGFKNVTSITNLDTLRQHANSLILSAYARYVHAAAQYVPSLTGDMRSAFNTVIGQILARGGHGEYVSEDMTNSSFRNSGPFSPGGDKVYKRPRNWPPGDPDGVVVKTRSEWASAVEVVGHPLPRVIGPYFAGGGNRTSTRISMEVAIEADYMELWPQNQIDPFDSVDGMLETEIEIAAESCLGLAAKMFGLD